MYGLHSHSGDLVEDDIYVSDGSVESESDEEETGDEGEQPPKDKSKKKLELVLTTSKMGLMRRGGISSLLGQPVNRTWVRSEPTTKEEGDDVNDSQDDIKREEEEEIITDPVVLLQIQQRKIEQAKQNARILESSENAGRDPCLFSKRTAFDIRMDQIEDKPWEKSGGADITDYMNYGLTEEDWIVSQCVCDWKMFVGSWRCFSTHFFFDTVHFGYYSFTDCRSMQNDNWLLGE
jgi:hypothetical protein